MNKLLIILLAIALFPFQAHAITAVPWLATSTTAGVITPAKVNGVDQNINILGNLTVSGTTTSGAIVSPIYSSGVCSGLAFQIGSYFNVNCTNGNVGIGTASPGFKLDIRGNVNVQGVSGNSYIAINHGAEYRVQVQSTVFSINQGNPATAPFTISAGNVGIGTTAPTSKLEVAGVVTAGDQASGTSGQVIIRGRETSDIYRTTVGTLYSSGGAYFGRGVKPSTSIVNGFEGGYTATTGGGALQIINDGSFRFITVPSQAMTLGGAITTSEAVRITSAGRVGIGTASPTASLEVIAPIATKEIIAKFGVADAVSSYISIENSSSIAGAFLPTVIGYNGDDARSGLLNKAYVEDTTESGRYYPAISFNAVNRAEDALTSAPIVGFGTDLNIKLATWYDGSTKIGGIQRASASGEAMTKPGTMLDVIDSTGLDLMNLLDGSTSRFYVKESGNVGIGTTNPSTKLEVSGGTNNNFSINPTGSSLVATLGRTGTNRGAAFNLNTNGTLSWTFGTSDSDSAGDGTEFFIGQEGGGLNAGLWMETNGNVGIGTTAPTTLLSVQNANGAASTVRIAGNGGNNALDIGSYSTDANSPTVLRTFFSEDIYFTPGDVVTGTPKMVIGADGNIGIGTTSPSAKLSVTGSGTGTGKAFSIANSSNAEKFTVLDNGNVGIGTSVPSYKTHILGGTAGAETTLLTIQSNFTDTISTLRFGNSSSATAPQGTAEIAAHRTNTGTSGATDLVFRNSIGLSVTEKMRILANGRVGIGTVSPAAPLNVASGVNSTTEGIRVSETTDSTNRYLSLSSSNITMTRQGGSGVSLDLTTSLSSGAWGTGGGAITFKPRESEAMRIASDGNVGIGTTTPAMKLDVYGQIRATSPTKPTCTASLRGAIQYDESDDHFYGCRTAGWAQLNN